MSKQKAKKKAYAKELSLALKERTKKTKQQREESEECKKMKSLDEMLSGS